MNLKKSMTALIVALSLVAVTSTRARATSPTIEMVQVPGGCFQMGDNFGDGDIDEKPVHEVCVNDFQIGKYEVTQAQWVAVMESNLSEFTDDKRPVEQVSWDDVQLFIRELNAQTGRPYRLPTEAEWEYAAKSGGKKEKWSGTTDPNMLGGYAWYDKNSSEKTHVVGTKKPNGLGIHDMSGNVWEWCQDKYGEDWYKESGRNNPHGPITGPYRIGRGGSWLATSSTVRAALRIGIAPGDRLPDGGFRLALPAVDSEKQRVRTQLPTNSKSLQDEPPLVMLNL